MKILQTTVFCLVASAALSGVYTAQAVDMPKYVADYTDVVKTFATTHPGSFIALGIISYLGGRSIECVLRHTTFLKKVKKFLKRHYFIAGGFTALFGICAACKLGYVDHQALLKKFTDSLPDIFGTEVKSSKTKQENTEAKKNAIESKNQQELTKKSQAPNLRPSVPTTNIAEQPKQSILPADNQQTIKNLAARNRRQ